MMLEDLYKELKKISDMSSGILRDSGYIQQGEISVDNYDRLTADEKQIYRICYQQVENLNELYENVKYLERNIEREGTLHWNPRSKRYEFDGIELHCGDGVEVLLDDNEDGPEWARTRIEMARDKDSKNHDGYYLVGLPDIYIEGLQARRRY